MDLASRVLEKIRAIRDPETGLTLGEMNLIQSVKETEAGIVQVDFALTSPFCPIALPIALRIREVTKSVEGVKRAYVYIHGHAMEKTINELVNRNSGLERSKSIL
jgi:metal-sulfur cluster biosynthetic enzyme